MKTKSSGARWVQHHFPAGLERWKTSFRLLSSRLAEDRLPLTASSLTYTTVLALVPLFTVVLSVLTAFPMFDEMQGALQEWLAQSLIPASISGNVMRYLTQFSDKASSLGMIGIIGLIVTSLSLVLTIDKTLNQIWRCRARRPVGQRILVYWAALTLGPFVLGSSLGISSYILSSSTGWLPASSQLIDAFLGLLRLALMAGGLTLLYRFVPNTPVRWKHALAGAVLVALCMALARHGLGLYLARAHTYTTIYGAFSVVPILLLWIYISWLIVLFGAVVAAYLPTLACRIQSREGPGQRFVLACGVVGALFEARRTGQGGLTLHDLAEQLRTDPIMLGDILQNLQQMKWTGRLSTQNENEAGRHVLLLDSPDAPLKPLVSKFLLDLAQLERSGWAQKPLDELMLADVLALDGRQSGDNAAP